MKVKVYVLMYLNFHSDLEYEGVYGTRQAAEDRIAHFVVHEQSGFTIEEEEVELPEEN